MNPFWNVICLFMVLAVPYESLVISYKSWVYSPEDGVVCDKGKKQCFNGLGFSPKLTKEYFNEERIHTSDSVPKQVQLSNDVICDFDSKHCKSETYGKDEYFERVLFLNNQLTSSINQ
ncbi:YcgJ family protein [Plesiomonas shigelloides]|uniref:YcgJ family protein n=2 Tax=Enterobacteriaceae TaxID=543 RepID=UPI0012616E3D|nr:hypothetical protein GBN28_10510 [Plesiomonas shigelloides]